MAVVENMFSMKLPELCLPELKCSGCKLYLSVGPVSTNTGKDFFCGRCPKAANEVKIYETLADKFLFPCCYESFGCKRLNRWGYVEAHERTCIKKPAPCPAVFDNCDWNGSMEDLRLHILQTHTTECMGIPRILFQLLDIVNTYRETLVLKLNVSQLEEIICTHKPKFEIVLFSYSRKIGPCAINLKPYNLLNHDNIQHKFKIDTSIADLNWDAPTPPWMCFEIKIAERGRKSNPLMCCQCNSLLNTGDVRVCQMGCYSCNSCVSEVDNCPRCHKKFLDNRISFHKCKNEVAGCFFSGSLQQVQEHEATCDFYVCPLKISEGCSWIGDYRDVLSHCIADHYRNTFATYGWWGYFDVLWDSGTFCLLQHNQLVFRLGIHVADEDLAVAIQLVGPARKADEYLYKLVFISQKTDAEISVKGCCQKLTDEKSAFDNCVKVQHSLIKNVEKNLSNVVFVLRIVDRERCTT